MLFKNKQMIKNTNITNSQVIQAGGNVTLSIDKETLEQLNAASCNTPLLKRLVCEKLDICRQMIMHVNETEARKILDTFFTFGVNGLAPEIRQDLYFLRYLLLRYEDKIGDAEQCMELLDEDQLNEIKRINLLLANQKIPEIHSLRPESQAFVLNRFFVKGMYCTIVSEYVNLKQDENDLSITWKYYAGISYFNMHSFEEAEKCLNGVFPVTKCKMHEMVAILSRIQYLFWNNCLKHSAEGLQSAFADLESLLKNHPEAKCGNENLVLGIELQYYFSKDLNLFKSKYQELSPLEKASDEATYYWALSCECEGKFEVALELYQKLKADDDYNIQARIMFCHLMLQKWEKVISIYNLIPVECRTSYHESVMLRALFHVDLDKYQVQLKKIVKKYIGDVDDMFYLACATENRVTDFDETIFPVLQESKSEILSHNNSSIKFGYANLLILSHHGEVAADILKTIEDYDVIDMQSIQLMGENLYRECNIEPSTIERIAELFIDQNREMVLFMKIKYNALLAQRKYLSALKNAKEIYKLTNALGDAYTVVTLAINVDSDNMCEYMPYIHSLMQSKNPEYLMAVAVADLRMGKSDEADRSGYYAMMCLDGEESFDIYGKYVGLNFMSVYEHKGKEVEPEFVKENSAVSVRCDDEVLTFCLEDMNDGWNLEKSQACDSVHIYYSNPIYYQLLDKRLGDSVIIDQKTYKVVSILDKYVYAFRFALNKLVNDPQKSPFPFVAINASSADELIEQLQKSIPETAGNGVLESYINPTNPFGIPIEAICNNRYEDYMEVVRVLLFQENQKLYAGNPIVFQNDEKIRYQYVVTIPTLVVMCQFQALDCLKSMADQIIIPKSTIKFVRKCAYQQKKLQDVSPGKLVNLPGGRFMLFSRDEMMKDAWNSILEICSKFKICDVSKEEVMNLDIVAGMSAETLFASGDFDQWKIDSFVLAKRENAIYVSDDAFYRMLANLLRIPNCNLVGLLHVVEFGNQKRAIEVAEQVEKSNYTVK